MKFRLVFSALICVLIVGAWTHGSLPTYTGPGDINSYTAWYGMRAYSAAKRGLPLVNACVQVGAVDTCGDLSSSASTGDLVPALIGGTTCPGAGCTIKTFYDLTGNGNPVSQPTVALRPTFQTGAFGGTRTCAAFSGTQYLLGTTLPFGSTDTISYVAERTGNFGNFNTIFAMPNLALGFDNAANTVYQFAGLIATAPAWDNQAHTVQALISGTSSSFFVDGTSTTVSAGTQTPTGSISIGANGGDSPVDQFLQGTLCEAGVAANANVTANNSLISTNQTAWYKLPPGVVLTAPPAGSVSGTIAVSATCGLSCNQVAFQVDGAPLGSPIIVAPYQTTLNTATLSSGSHTIAAVGTSATGSNTASAVVSTATFQGIGDIAAANGFAHQVWYGVRAYSAAKRGQALMHVCDSSGTLRTVSMGTGNGSQTSFSIASVANLPIRVGSVKIITTIGGATVNAYDGPQINVGPPPLSNSGVINGMMPQGGPTGRSAASVGGPASSSTTGTINYATGAITVSYWPGGFGVPAAPPDNGAAVTLTYTDLVDNSCVDMFSDPGTGDLKPITFPTGVTCPNTLGTCTIQTAYDLTKSTASGSGGGVDVTQPNINQRPWLMKRAVFQFQVERACMWWPDGLNFLNSTANANWGGGAVTISAVLQNSSTTQRPGNPLFVFSGGGAQTTFSAAIQAGSTNAASRAMNAGSIAFASQVGVNISSAMSLSGAPSVDGSQAAIGAQEHHPHAIQALISANGTSSSMYLDGNLNSNLNTGNAIPVSAIVSLGGQTFTAPNPGYGNSFEGVICEIGFAQGDQTAGTTGQANSQMNTNQTTYYLTPNATWTKVFDWTVNFNNQTPTGQGFQMTLPIEQALFNDPSIINLTNSNYTNGTPTGSACLGYGGGGGCVPAAKVLLAIVPYGHPDDGVHNTPGMMAGMAVECNTPTSGCTPGGGQPGQGLGQTFFDLRTPPSSGLPPWNYIVQEWDQLWVPASLSPNGLNFDTSNTGGVTKGGVYTNPQNNAVTNAGMGIQIILDGAPNNLNLGFDPTHSGNAISWGHQLTGTVTIGTWYHFKFENANGPNGWSKLWRDNGPGTPLVIIDALGRGQTGGTDPFSDQTATADYPNFSGGVQPHYGGGTNTGPNNDSYIVYDNFHVTGYAR